jgi:hypothetical protein
MVDLHDQIANLGLELFVLGFQLAFAAGWTIDQCVVSVLNAPPLDQTSGQLLIPCGLGDGHCAGLDLRDQLTFEFGFEFSTNFSHYEYRSPRPQIEKKGGREGLWKMPQLWKSTKGAFGGFFLMISTSYLEKPPQKTLRLFHIYHSPGGGGTHSTFFRVRGSLNRSACTNFGGKTLQS